MKSYNKKSKSQKINPKIKKKIMNNQIMFKKMIHYR